MENTPQNSNNMLDEVNKDLEQESASIGHSLLVPGIMIGVIVLLLGAVGWYIVSTWLTPRAPTTVEAVINDNANIVPVQVTGNTVETEGVGKTQIVDEETRRRLAEEASASLKAAQLIAGKESTQVFTAELATHMEQLRKMRNYLFINVQTLLLGNSNKEKLLADYMNTLIGERQKAGDHVAKLQTNIALLKTDFDAYTADQKRFQTAYKEAVANYDPQGTAANLEAFIGSQTMAAETFARMRAMQSMTDIYGKVLTAMDTKMKFIAANKEALLKEVEVVDVKSLEEKLILSEKEWLQSLQ